MERILELADEAYSLIIDAQGRDLAGKYGQGSYIAVRIRPDGTVYETQDTSRCLSADEFNRRVPHTLTVADFSAHGGWTGAEEDCPIDDDGDWHEYPDFDDYRHAEIESAIREWVAAGNLQA